MATARDFVTLALKEAGVLGLGQSAVPEDINDAFTLLKRMLAQWQTKRWLVPSLMNVMANGNGLKSNPIGPGQYFNSIRPNKIQAAYFKQLNTGSNPVSYPLIPIWSYEDYALVQLKDLASFPQYFFYDNAYPYGNVHIWPIPDASYELHLIIKGPVTFDVELLAGVVTNAGIGYVNGVYPAVPLVNLSGYGSGATADITVAGGVVSTVTLNVVAGVDAGGIGNGYKLADTLSVAPASVGGTGAGFIYTATKVTSDLDAQFNLPDEYQEAVHYNLCARIVSMYQYPPNQMQLKLAAAALRTIKQANLQIPSLKMPSSLNFAAGGGGFSIYNADAR